MRPTGEPDVPFAEDALPPANFRTTADVAAPFGPEWSTSGVEASPVARRAAAKPRNRVKRR